MSNELEWGTVPGPGLTRVRNAEAVTGASTRTVMMDRDEDDAWTDADEEEDEDLDELDDLDDDDDLDDEDLDDDDDWEDDEEWDEDLDEDEDEM